MTEIKGLISVIMPVYNSAHYIADSISSVQNQTCTNWELLIIDDCSTDDTSKIISKLINSDHRIKYMKNEVNCGVGKSRNKGISNARGEWVAFLDSDDCWLPEKLYKQLIFATVHNAEFTFTGSTFIDEFNQKIKHNFKVSETVSYKQLLKQNIISCSSVLIKRKFLLDYPMPSNNLHEDFVVWLQILKNNHISAYGLNEPLLVYRISSKSKSGNKLKASIMTFRVYRFIGLNIPMAIFYWLCYFFKSLEKYLIIHWKA